MNGLNWLDVCGVGLLSLFALGLCALWVKKISHVISRRKMLYHAGFDVRAWAERVGLFDLIFPPAIAMVIGIVVAIKCVPIASGIMVVGILIALAIDSDNCWSDEQAPKAPFTGWACDKNGKHFLDRATAEQLASFTGLVLFVSGHRMERNIEIYTVDNEGIGLVTADLTIAATAESIDFQQSADNLITEVTKASKVTLAWYLERREDDGWQTLGDELRMVLGDVAKSLHEQERNVRFGLTYSLESTRKLFSDRAPK